MTPCAVHGCRKAAHPNGWVNMDLEPGGGPNWDKVKQFQVCADHCEGVINNINRSVETELADTKAQIEQLKSEAIELSSKLNREIEMADFWRRQADPLFRG